MRQLKVLRGQRNIAMGEEQRQCRRANQNGTGRRKVEFSLTEN